MRPRGRFLLVVFDGGGTVTPALAIARRLVARGHEVATIGPAILQARFEAAGSTYTRYARVPEWDAARGRAYEDQQAVFLDLLCGTALAEDVLAEVETRRPDVAVVDCMLGGAICALERTQTATAAFVHVLYQPWVSGWGAGFFAVGPTRKALGLRPLDVEPPLGLLEHVDAALLLTAAELDFPGEVAANSRYVGPVFDDDPSARGWRSPWPDGDQRPLVVVSMSTTYQHQERALAAVLAALADLPVRVLVTLGPHLRPDEVEAPPNAAVLTWVPHRRVLADASLVVTHAGHGTVVVALAHGVPLLCLPLGRDQHVNAERVVALGAGEVLAADADPTEIRLAAETLLASARHRRAARAIARSIAGYGDGAQAIQAVEALL